MQKPLISGFRAGLKKLLYIFCFAALLISWSEHLFWARVELGSAEKVVEWGYAYVLGYTIPAFFALWLAVWARAHDFWSWFMAGAFFGWITEGLLVQTAYDMLPFSLSFTGLAWHALITFGIGVYGLPLLRRRGTPRQIVKYSALFGLCWGGWSVAWWMETPPVIVPAHLYVLYAFMLTAVTLGLYRIMEMAPADVFRFRKWELWVLIVLFSGLYLLLCLPKAPVSLVILPVLLGATVFVLRRNRESGKDFYLPLVGGYRTPVRRDALFFIAPLAASLVYVVADAMEIRFAGNMVLYLITMPAGFIVYAVAVRKILRRSYPYQ